jgi:hypothetical protein
VRVEQLGSHPAGLSVLYVQAPVIDPEIVIVPIVFCIPAIVLVIRMAFKHREKMASLGGGTEQSQRIEARLERVEQAMDAIAFEVERIGEGQRFITKVFAERNNMALPESTTPRDRVKNT